VNVPDVGPFFVILTVNSDGNGGRISLLGGESMWTIRDGDGHVSSQRWPTHFNNQTQHDSFKRDPLRADAGRVLSPFETGPEGHGALYELDLDIDVLTTLVSIVSWRITRLCFQGLTSRLCMIAGGINLRV
jgi:hypothetical protein